MSVFNRIFHARDKPKDSTAGGSFAFYLGGSTAGKQVNERTSMQMTAVYACVRILSEAIAGLPLHLYRYKDDGGKEKAIDHPLYLLLHDEPNPEMSSFVFRETLMTHLLLWGNAYAQIIRNGKGEVIALYPLMPNKMTVDRDEKGQLYYTYSRSNDEAKTMEGSEVKLSPSDVLHTLVFDFKQKLDINGWTSIYDDGFSYEYKKGNIHIQFDNVRPSEVWNGYEYNLEYYYFNYSAYVE